MAPVIPQARAARAEASRLLGETMGLKLALRETAAQSREQRRAAQEAKSLVHARRAKPLPSPWSELTWSYYTEPLAGVLTPIP